MILNTVTGIIRPRPPPFTQDNDPAVTHWNVSEAKLENCLFEDDCDAALLLVLTKWVFIVVFPVP